MPYAEGTTVSVSRTREELEKYLVRRGATGFMSGWTAEQSQVAFIWKGRHIRIDVPLLDQEDPRITHTDGGRRRTTAQHRAAYEKMQRERWRAVFLIVKAKVETIEIGASTLDQEFGMSYVMPDGSTVGEQVIPRINQAYETGRTPELLPAPRRAIEMGTA